MNNWQQNIRDFLNEGNEKGKIALKTGWKVNFFWTFLLKKNLSEVHFDPKLMHSIFSNPD